MKAKKRIFAIYVRKSKLTDSGDSINNQVELCKNYISANFAEEYEIVIYEDEGFSGGNQDRPMFQKLLKDIRNGKINVLVCYRLDRISRNVVDFSSVFEELESNGVEFISINERFDTTSPMGKAMMYISSVFAQLEKDTIAERIKDNLLELAKSGRYLQAKAPLGFDKEKIAYTDKNNVEKYYNLLKTNEEEKKIVIEIFNRYFNRQSISSMETEFLQKGRKTRNGTDYKQITFRRILSHPIYCTADLNAYNYFKSLGCNIINAPEEFNGKFGVYIFRRFKSKEKSVKETDPENWVIGIGSHEPFVDSTVWIKTQEVMEERKVHTKRRPIGKTALLSGILKCGNCGAYMRPYAKVGDRFYYICNTKEISKRKLCTIKNIRGDKLDNKILGDIASMLQTQNLYQKILSDKKSISEKKNTMDSQLKKCYLKIEENKKSIKNLVKKLAMSDSVIESHLQEYINDLDNENKELMQKIHDLENKIENVNEEEINNNLLTISFDKLLNSEDDIITKRNLLKNIIEDIVFDGENLTVNFIKY